MISHRLCRTNRCAANHTNRIAVCWITAYPVEFQRAAIIKCPSFRCAGNDDANQGARGFDANRILMSLWCRAVPVVLPDKAQRVFQSHWSNLHRNNYAESLTIHKRKTRPTVCTLVDYEPVQPTKYRPHMMAMLIIHGYILMDTRFRQGQGIY